MERAGDILKRNMAGLEIAKKPAPKKIAAAASTRPVAAETISLPEKLLDAAVAIRQRPPLTSELAYMAKHMMQVTLPHSDPGDVALWSRTNGDVKLVIARTAEDEDGNPIGYPYGVIPRLLLFWITSEAVRNKNRQDKNPRLIELGSSLAEFMLAVGLSPEQGGGKRSDAKRLKDQMNRLFSASIAFQQVKRADGFTGQRVLAMPIAPNRELWWGPRSLLQGSLWKSWIELGEEFYNTIVTSAVPADTRALRGLRKSPLALDIYGWATYKAFSLYQTGQSQFISYRDFMSQFGTDYSDPKDFKKYLVLALKKVQEVYPDLKIESTRGGLTIYPSRPSVPPSGRSLLP